MPQANCKIELGIVIPTFNRKTYLKRLLSQLFSQEVEHCHFEILVVVDGSTDGTFEMLREEFPGVHIVEGPGDWWYTKSMNEGFKCAEKFKPDYILTLNDDITLTYNFIQQLINAQGKMPEKSILGCVSLTTTKPHKIFFSGIRNIKWWKYKIVNYHKLFEQVDESQLTGIVPSKALPGRGMLIPTEVLRELDYFDEGFVQYGSDEDFCLRAAKIGVQSYVCWDAKLFSYVENTGKGTTYIKQSLREFLLSFFNKYSRCHLPKYIKMCARHGNLILLPITILIVILGSLKSYFYMQRT